MLIEQYKNMIKGNKNEKKFSFILPVQLYYASVQVTHADEVGEKESAVAESEAVTT